MATTKIVLDLQSDLILSSPSITTPLGIVAGDIAYGSSNVNAELGTLSSNISQEVSELADKLDVMLILIINYIDLHLSKSDTYIEGIIIVIIIIFINIK